LINYNAIKIEGDIHLEFKDFKAALGVYKRLKRYCDDKKRYREKIVCYGQMGYVYAMQDEHNQAIKYYHKQLELAWEQGEEKYEL
jgi:tetratricopeptide (TPR) repeat protein